MLVKILFEIQLISSQIRVKKGSKYLEQFLLSIQPHSLGFLQSNCSLFIREIRRRNLALFFFGWTQKADKLF